MKDSQYIKEVLLVIKYSDIPLDIQEYLTKLVNKDCEGNVNDDRDK